MKMWGRRSFLRAFAAAPIAGRVAAEQVAMELSGIAGNGCAGAVPSPSGLRDIISGDHYTLNQTPGQQGTTDGYRFFSEEGKRQFMKTVLADPKARNEVRALAYRMNRRVHSIDPDIGVMRSWSLASKIAYQRQRNVEFEIEDSVRHESPWSAMKSWVDDKLSGFLLG